MSKLIARGAVLGLIAVSLVARSAMADAEGAKKAIAQAKTHIADSAYDAAETDLKLAEAELDGVSGADKDAITKSITDTRASIASTKNAAAHDDTLKKTTYLVEQARKSVASQRDMEILQADYDRMIASDDYKSLSADERTTFEKQWATVKKVATASAADTNIKDVETKVASLEKDQAEIAGGLGKPRTEADVNMQIKLRDYDILVQSAGEQIKLLPQDDPRAKALIERYTKVSTAYANATTGNEASALATQLKNYWNSRGADSNGWEQETTAPTMAGFIKENKGARDVAPKTAAVVQNANDWLKNLGNGQEYTKLKDAPPVKSLVDDITRQRDTARAKMAKFIAGMIDEGEKMTFQPNEGATIEYSLKNDAMFALGEDAPQLPALLTRIKALSEKIAGAANASAKAVEDLTKKLTDSATAAWPNIASGLNAQDVTDASKLSGDVGKIVHLKKNNRLGWDYTGDYNFAAAVNGFVVAGRFAPHVKAAYTEVSGKVGGDQSIPDDEWDVIGKVVGPGKINAKLSADVRDQSGSNIGTVEGKEARDCAVIEIIAMRAGPLAVGPDGVVDESGKAVVPASATGAFANAGSAGGTGGGFSAFVWRLFVLVVGMTAAASCLLKAGYAPLAALPQAGQVQARLGNDNLAYVGLACAAIGLLFLLRGMIIYGFLVNAAIIVAGLFAAIDLLAARGLVKPDLLAKIRPLGVPIGLACAGIVIVNLLLGLVGMNMYII